MKTLIAAFTLAAFAHIAAAQDLVMGVSEGTSGGLDHAQVISKYQGLADVIGRSIKQKVNVIFVREFGALEDGMKVGRFDFVIARPSDYPARGLREACARPARGLREACATTDTSSSQARVRTASVSSSCPTVRQ